MKRKTTLTISISSEDKEEVDRQSDKLKARWGNKPSVSKLLRKIAKKEIVMYNQSEGLKIAKAQIEALKSLIKCCKFKETLILANHLYNCTTEEIYVADIFNLIKSFPEWDKVQTIVARETLKIKFPDEIREIQTEKVTFKWTKLTDKEELMLIYENKQYRLNNLIIL